MNFILCNATPYHAMPYPSLEHLASPPHLASLSFTPSTRRIRANAPIPIILTPRNTNAHTSRPRLRPLAALARTARLTQHPPAQNRRQRWWWLRLLLLLLCSLAVSSSGCSRDEGMVLADELGAGLLGWRCCVCCWCGGHDGLWRRGG